MNLNRSCRQSRLINTMSGVKIRNLRMKLWCWSSNLTWAIMYRNRWKHSCLRWRTSWVKLNIESSWLIHLKSWCRKRYNNWDFSYSKQMHLYSSNLCSTHKHQLDWQEGIACQWELLSLMCSRLIGRMKCLRETVERVLMTVDLLIAESPLYLIYLQVKLRNLSKATEEIHLNHQLPTLISLDLKLNNCAAIM